MSLPKHLAKHINEFHVGPNWTASDLENALKDVTWQQATKSVFGLNTIVALVYHIHYFVAAVIPVLEGGKLDAHDKFSFDHPSIDSAEDWKKLQQKVFADAKKFAQLVEQMAESKFLETMEAEKYGSFYRNIQGTIEHSYYHLGQIVLVKKILLEAAKIDFPVAP